MKRTKTKGFEGGSRFARASFLNALKGEKMSETKSLERLLDKTVKLYNKAIAQKGKGKTISAKSIDKNGETQYSKRATKFKYQPRDFSQITETEYNHHAWASVNNILSQNEIGSLIKKIGEKKNGTSFAQTADGLYMIPVGENGVENKVVYTDGDWESPSIEALVEINSLSDETLLDEARRYLYDSERRGIQRKASQLFRFHYAEDYGYAEWSKNVGSMQENSAQRSGERDGNRTFEEVRKSRRVTDSDGVLLTDAQAEYFKDSKVRDKDGKLLVVYHGSPNVFTEFSDKFMNTHGNSHGRGFYFTDDATYADGFKKEGGQLLKGYLNIRKPASETEITISKAELVKLIKATCEAQAQEFVDEESYDNIDDALLDTWVSNYVNTYDANSMDSVYRQVAESIIKNNDNDVDIFAEMANGGGGASRVLSLATKIIGYDGVIFDNGNGTYQFIAFRSNQFKNADNASPTGSEDIRYSRRITAGMSDQERYMALKDRVIENVPISQDIPQSVIEGASGISSWEDINRYYSSEKKHLIRKIAEEFGVFKDYANQDVELEFDFSKSNFNESYGKQKKRFASFAKKFSIFDDVVEKAVGIEVHNRNSLNYKTDDTLKNVYVLVSAFQDNNDIIPVKLEVKEFSDKKILFM